MASETVQGKIEKIDKNAIFIDGKKYVYTKHSKGDITRGDDAAVGTEVALEFKTQEKDDKITRWIGKCLLVSDSLTSQASYQPPTLHAPLVIKDESADMKWCIEKAMQTIEILKPILEKGNEASEFFMLVDNYVKQFEKRLNPKYTPTSQDDDTDDCSLGAECRLELFRSKVANEQDGIKYIKSRVKLIKDLDPATVEIVENVKTFNDLKPAFTDDLLIAFIDNEYKERNGQPLFE